MVLYVVESSELLAGCDQLHDLTAIVDDIKLTGFVFAKRTDAQTGALHK